MRIVISTVRMTSIGYLSIVLGTVDFVIPLYMDEHVPRAITIGLRLRGVDVLTVQEDNLSGKSDRELLDRAFALKRAIFTNDVDHLVEATKRQQAAQPFYGVIFAHHLRVSIGTCIKDLELPSLDRRRNN